MRVKELHLKNFRGFSDLKITFPLSNITVLLGYKRFGKIFDIGLYCHVLRDSGKTHYVIRQWIFCWITATIYW